MIYLYSAYALACLLIGGFLVLSLRRLGRLEAELREEGR
jgi:CcmD family protein